MSVLVPLFSLLSTVRTLNQAEFASSVIFVIFSADILVFLELVFLVDAILDLYGYVCDQVEENLIW